MSKRRLFLWIVSITAIIIYSVLMYSWIQEGNRELNGLPWEKRYDRK